MLQIQLTISFDPDLRTLLHPVQSACRFLQYPLNRKASIKDVIESLHVPHTEIGCMIVNNLPVDFSYIPKNGDTIIIQSQIPPVDPCHPHLLRPAPLLAIRFMVDVNVAKLGSLLRMTGFDCTYQPHLDDADIAISAVREGRILLSRDRNLLKRKLILHGHLVRTHFPYEQLNEVLNLYGLRHAVKPYSRCMKCNTLLYPISKRAVVHRLEPLTKKYFDTFYHCRGCDSIYWPGSHKSGMDEILAKVLA
jgi:uncharacterized protein